MTKYDIYLKELEDLSSYTESEDFSPDQYLIKLYDLYKNGNFLAINLITSVCKSYFEMTKDKSYLDLPLSIYEKGVINVFDLDFVDQNNLLLQKGEFYAYYAVNVDRNYSKIALETLNYYANTNKDGRHLKAKALLEKPSSNEDTLHLELYKNLLLEYFSYGNDLDESELEVVNIPSTYLTLDEEGLLALEKENIDNKETLKNIYYVLLHKGFYKYAYNLKAIDNTFILDYYLSKVDPFNNIKNNLKTKKGKVLSPQAKNKKGLSPIEKRFKFIFIINIIFILVSSLVPIGGLNTIISSSFFSAYSGGYGNSSGLSLSILIMAVFILDSLVLCLCRKSRIVSIIFSILCAAKTTFFLVGCILEYGMTSGNTLFILLNYTCVIFGFINAYRNKFNPKVEKKKKEVYEEENHNGNSYFDGKLLELIGYKILGALITAFTFGLGRPWAVCFVSNWSTKHQTIDDKRLAFNGHGAQLFGKYIIWLILTIITFGIYGLWLTIKMKKWVIYHTHLKDNFSQYEENSSSSFDGGLLQLIGYNIVSFLMTVFTLGIAYPWAVCLKLKWETKHTYIDGKRLAFNGNGGQLFGKYIIWLILTIITFGIFGLWLSIKMKKWTVSHTHFVNENKSTFMISL